jgi:hypothetical protein
MDRGVLSKGAGRFPIIKDFRPVFSRALAR